MSHTHVSKSGASAKTDSQSMPASGRQHPRVQQILHRSSLQAKLTIGEPNDRFEQEADRIAEQVMRMPDTRVVDANDDSSPGVSVSAASNDGAIQRVCTSCQEDEGLIQAKHAGSQTPEITPVLTAGLRALGAGQPLSGPQRNYFEPRIGEDFSQVRVHHDRRAADLANAVKARAFTQGRDIVFGTGEYAPGSSSGRKLLAHELTHVVQQRGSQNSLQAKYKLDELKKQTTSKVDSSPDTYFYKGSPANTKDKKALIIAGLHAQEVSPCELGKEVQGKLQKGTIKPDLHTVIAPCVVPDPKQGRGAGTGSEKVADLNREFGGKTPSKNPLANKITQIVNEFKPDQTVSIHAIGDSKLAGIFLDPEYSGKFPATRSTSQKKKVFTHIAGNEEAMRLTEDMITAARRSEGADTTTKGNTAGTKILKVRVKKKKVKGKKQEYKVIKKKFTFPQNKYPSKGASPFNLLYPQQSQINAAKRPTSLGVWMAGLGKTVITMELPGYKTPKSKWQHFIPALVRFMQLPGNRAYGPQVTTEAEKLNYLIGTLDRKKAGLDFGKRGQKIDLGKGVIPYKLTKNLNLREGAFRCLEAMMKDAKAAGHDIIPFSGTRLFKQQKGIWEKKFKFKNISYDWGRLDPKALKSKYATECGGLKDTETEWHSNTRKDKTRTALHKKCWKKLTAEEKAKEILKTSSGPGFSRHHWGTDVDINSDKPQDWSTDKKLIALYKWLTANAHKYGYYEAFNAGRPAGKGYTQEKWHWSFAPISVPLQADYEKQLLTSGAAKRALLEKKIAKVAGKDEALKLFKEYVETINPDLRGNKKIARPGCMPIGTGADIPTRPMPGTTPSSDTI